MPKGFPTPGEKREQAIALAQTSMTEEQIAKMVGVSRRTLIRIWDKAGVSRKHISIETMGGEASTIPEGKQVDGPHQQTLRKLTQSWLDEMRQLERGKLVFPLIEPFLSGGKVLKIAKVLKQVSLQFSLQETQSPPECLPEQPPAERWRTQAEGDEAFPQLREHLKKGPVFPLYEMMGFALGQAIMFAWHWRPALEAAAVGLLAVKAQNPEEWRERLLQDALLREQVSLVAQPAFYLLTSELMRLTVADAPPDPELQLWTLVLEQEQADMEHRLQGACSVTRFQLTADEIRHWAQQTLSRTEWQPLKDELLRELRALSIWQPSKDALTRHLAALVELHPFPGQCSACPV